MPNGEYSNLGFLATPGLFPKSSPVKYWHFSNLPDTNAESSAASRSRLYWACVALILPSIIFGSSVNVIFIMNLKDFF